MTVDSDNKSDKNPMDTTSHASWKVLAAVAFTIFVLWIVSVPALLVVTAVWGDIPWQKTGTIGDSFGAVSALFSGLALFFVAYAILLQRKELSLQREDIQQSTASQKEAEKRQFLTAYMNTIDGLRQWSHWRMSYSPSIPNNLSLPYVEGLVNQMRVGQALTILVREVQPEVVSLYPNLSRVGEKGSHVWIVEQLLGSYISIRRIRTAHSRDINNPEDFIECVKKADIQISHIRNLSDYLSEEKRSTLQSHLNTKLPDATRTEDNNSHGKDARSKYIQDLGAFAKLILTLATNVCNEE